ncbi:MAG: MFS transporter [Gammaproteobacteria bacterium]|jgi:MFS family permease|nr:MFS transporter [Gammaproteobacteria bacterium]
MVGTLSRVTALLISVSILLTGHGLQLTLLPVHAQLLGWGDYAIGLTGSLYFLGFVIGCAVIPSVVAGVGHIRTFMVMGAIATIALLAAGLWPQLGVWLVLRGASGFALAGLYMVIESWLSEVSPHEQRGRVLAIYTLISLLAMALGQAFMGVGSPASLQLFMVGGILLCLAIVPLGLARVASPAPVPALRFTPRILLRASRVSVVCAFFAGLVVGSFWALGPVVGRAFGLDGGAIGALMSVGILGGAVAQVPVGRWSDHTDRRLVIGTLMLAGAGTALLGALFATQSPLLLYLAMFCIGATTMPLYALCIANASDHTDIPLVEVASGILMIHSIGAIIGPVSVAALLSRFGPESFFGYTLLCLIIPAVWALHRYRSGTPEHEHAAGMANLPRTTQVAATLSAADDGLAADEPAP